MVFKAIVDMIEDCGREHVLNSRQEERVLQQNECFMGELCERFEKVDYPNA